MTNHHHAQVDDPTDETGDTSDGDLDEKNTKTQKRLAQDKPPYMNIVQNPCRMCGGMSVGLPVRVSDDNCHRHLIVDPPFSCAR